MVSLGMLANDLWDDKIKKTQIHNCEYCGQSQPNTWQGGACTYCGAPVNTGIAERLRSIEPYILSPAGGIPHGDRYLEDIRGYHMSNTT